MKRSPQFVINQESTATIKLSAWGTSNGAFIKSEEPVDMIVELSFDRPNGPSFVKQFVARLSQF